MTPEQAWEHVKALWPEATHMERYRENSMYPIPVDAPDAIIDWPEGVDRWPPTCKESSQVEYIEPDQRHVGLEVEVWDDEGDTTSKRKLIEVLPENYVNRFLAQCWDDLNDWASWRNARVPADPMRDAPKDRVIEGCVENKWIPVFWNSLKEHWQNGPRKVDPVTWREVQ